MAMKSSSACGRFAPSPTGPLHFGSLVAALGSCLEARIRGGQWRVRMEDVDTPRCKPAHADAILRTLEACGFEWDGTVLVQSQRTRDYAEALEKLKALGVAYPCACTRSELEARSGILGVDGSPVYPGTCRNGLPPGKSARAWRLRVAGEIQFHDAIQGRQTQDLVRAAGDCVLLRADGLFAYQLAVVVDDAAQGIDHVVRGADLIHSTARQITLQRWLGLATPSYAHLPVAVDAQGQKLSKQTLASPVEDRQPVPALVAAARFLGQNPPPALGRGTCAEFWAWARAHWDIGKVPRVAAIAIDKEKTA